jgi:hypothetical protein
MKVRRFREALSEIHGLASADVDTDPARWQRTAVPEVLYWLGSLVRNLYGRAHVIVAFLDHRTLSGLRALRSYGSAEVDSGQAEELLSPAEYANMQRAIAWIDAIDPKHVPIPGR